MRLVVRGPMGGIGVPARPVGTMFNRASIKAAYWDDPTKTLYKAIPKA